MARRTKNDRLPTVPCQSCHGTGMKPGAANRYAESRDTGMTGGASAHAIGLTCFECSGTGRVTAPKSALMSGLRDGSIFALVLAALLMSACADPGPTEPTGSDGQGVVVDALEGANGAHIWMQPEDGQINKLHMRSPNTYSYDAARTGSYSQINLYADHLGLWGGTQPEGHALYLDQEALYPREDGTIDLGTASHRVGDVRMAGVLRSGSLAGESRRYACIEIDGTLTASIEPCVEGDR